MLALFLVAFGILIIVGGTPLARGIMKRGCTLIIALVIIVIGSAVLAFLKQYATYLIMGAALVVLSAGYVHYRVRRRKLMALRGPEHLSLKRRLDHD